MNDPPDERRLARQLVDAGIEIGISKSGRLLRVDNRQRPNGTDPQLWDQIIRCDRLRELTMRDVAGFLNEHVDSIAGLPKLRLLDVQGSDFSDMSLRRLADCHELQVVNVRHTRVTRECLKELRKSMIGTRIIY